MQSNFIGDKSPRHAVCASIYLYLLVAGAAAFVLAVWLKPLRAVVNAVFTIVAAYLVIIVGRPVLGKKNL